MPASSADTGVAADALHDPPGMHAGGRRAAVGIDGGDDELPIDQPDVEPGLAAQVDVVARVVGRRGNDGEVREAEPAQHVGEHRAKLAWRLGLDGLRTQIGADRDPTSRRRTRDRSGRP